MSVVTTVDHKTGHICARVASGRIRCAYMLCDAQPSPAEIAKLDAQEARRRDMKLPDYQGPTSNRATEAKPAGSNAGSNRGARSRILAPNK
jgi:hypothetical protein